MNPPLCIWCGDHGCLMCDGTRALLFSQRIAEEAALAFVQSCCVKDQGDGIKMFCPPQSLSELIHFTALAMQHGADRMRPPQETEAVRDMSDKLIGHRFSLLEIEA